MKSTVALRDSPGCCFSAASNSRASRTFQCAGISSSWLTYAAMRGKSLESLGRPLTKTSPLYLAVFFIANMSNKVVFPQPLGPMIATSCPASKCPEHGSKMVCFPPFGSDAVKERSLKVRLAGCSAALDLSTSPRFCCCRSSARLSLLLPLSALSLLPLLPLLLRLRGVASNCMDEEVNGACSTAMLDIAARTTREQVELEQCWLRT
mmetsp:Transcript_29730/g.74883  ORF Transcript_29730/g.74883 Transcript_29730/m.74883 type:complete len:207 (-) Transcript_29730:7-627(-)